MQKDDPTETVKKYYSIAGITVATLVTNGQGQVNDGTQTLYFLTDHLGLPMQGALFQLLHRGSLKELGVNKRFLNYW